MYLTFDTYKELGGKIEDESAFSVLEKRAERKLDFITNGKLKNLDEIPNVVMELLVQFISLLSVNDTTSAKQKTSYSNGVESFSYATQTQQEIDAQFLSLAKEYLFDTNLLYGGSAKFEYL